MRCLLIGCGSRREKLIRPDGTPDWGELVTLDITPVHKPDVVWDLNQRPLPFLDNSFDEIHGYHIFEHVGRQGDWRGFFEEFSEYHRILKPGGLLCGKVPLWESHWAWGDPGHTRVITHGTLVFLSQRAYQDGVGGTPMTDYRDFYKADFEPIMCKAVEIANQQDREMAFVLRAVK